jgi:uncharacterized membrane protein
MPSLRTAAPLGMAAAFAVSGAVHFVRPSAFEPLMPRILPEGAHRALIYASGAAEVVCALGLLRRRPWAPNLSTAVLVAVFPANLQMALDSGTGRNPGAADSRAVGWGRLPLQAAMIWAVRQGRPGQAPTG